MDRPVAILFDRLGPYHLARIRACAAIMPVRALELCGESFDYQWDAVKDAGLPRVTLFPGRDSSQVPSREIRQQIHKQFTLDRPAAVAVPGWGSPAALAALAWCGENDCPAVVMSESTASDEGRVAWKEWLKRRVLRFASAGLAGGSPQRAYLLELGLPAGNVFLGYDAVDNVYFEAAAGQARQQGDSLRASLGLPVHYFLASNRFIEKKNLIALLDAYAAYRRTAGEAAWSLVLLGDGPLRPKLEQRRAALGLEQAVQMPGFKQYEDLPVYYGLAAGFIHASTTEQWGLVVNEAMASSLPVLVSDRCGCAADLVAAGKNGWTFNPHDTAEIAAALGRLAALSADERLALGQCSRARIAEWSPERFAVGLQAAVRAAGTGSSRRIGAGDPWLLRALLGRS